MAVGTADWWRWWDSNPWPPACRAGALPTELHPRFGKWRVKSEECRVLVENSVFFLFHSFFDGHWKLNNSRVKHSAYTVLRFTLVTFAYLRYDTLVKTCPCLHRKEVIQPHLPIRLPCYDLTPIIEPTFDCCPLAVSSQASGVPNFHGLTGGVYKARERIHRGMLIRDY